MRGELGVCLGKLGYAFVLPRARRCLTIFISRIMILIRNFDLPRCPHDDFFSINHGEGGSEQVR